MLEGLALPAMIRRIYVFWVVLSGVPLGLWLVSEVAEQGSFDLIPAFDAGIAVQWLLVCGAAIGLSWLGSVYLAKTGPGKAAHRLHRPASAALLAVPVRRLCHLAVTPAPARPTR